MRHFDTNPLTVDRATEELRAHGLAALAWLLGADSDPPPGIEALAELLGIDGRYSAVRAHGLRRMGRSFLFEAFEPTSLFQEEVLASGVAPRRIDRTNDLLRRAWRRVRLRPQAPGAAGADLLLPGLVVMAFGALPARAAAVGLLRRSLRDRVLLTPDDMPIEAPAPQTLLALTVARGRPNRMPERAWEALQRAVTELLGQPGWAGFWDLWILGQVRATTGLDLPTACSDLPQPDAAPEEESDVAREHPALASDWRERAPAYARQLVAGQA